MHDTVQKLSNLGVQIRYKDGSFKSLTVILKEIEHAMKDKSLNYNHEKQILEIEPKQMLAEEKRLRELRSTIYRYSKSKLPIPHELLKEYNELSEENYRGDK